jgi:hypothetical protein
MELVCRSQGLHQGVTSETACKGRQNTQTQIQIQHVLDTSDASWYYANMLGDRYCKVPFLFTWSVDYITRTRTEV